MRSEKFLASLIVIFMLACISVIYDSVRTLYWGHRIIEVEVNGHQYIEFPGTGVIHDPDCSKCKEPIKLDEETLHRMLESGIRDC